MFQAATDEDIWLMADKLSQHAGTKAQLELQEKAFGLSRNSMLGILSSLTLRLYVKPAGCNTYDSMHCYYSNGTANFELHLILQAMATQLKIGFAQLFAFCECDWRAPRHSKIKASSVFAPAREHKDSFKAMASEIILVYPLIRHLIETVVAPSGLLGPQISSFRAMCLCLDTLTDIKMSHKVLESQWTLLQQRQNTHLQLFVAAYGLEEVKPKHHFSLHIPGQLKRDGVLLDLFVCERKHRSAKRHASGIDNTVAFERSVLARVLLEQVNETPTSFDDCLMSASVACPEIAIAVGCAQALVANSMKSAFVQFSNGDVLFNATVAMVVLACIQADAKFLLLVRPFNFVCLHGAGKLWKASKDIAVFEPQTGFSQPSTWTYQEDGLLLTLAK